MYNRERAIQELVNSDFEYIMSGDAAEILNSYLTYGFKGYFEFTDEELISELEQRDISSNFGEDDDGQPDEAQEWHDFDPDC
jgi:hypothetical protein